jgi:hypothetical protein
MRRIAIAIVPDILMQEPPPQEQGKRNGGQPESGNRQQQYRDYFHIYLSLMASIP